MTSARAAGTPAMTATSPTAAANALPLTAPPSPGYALRRPSKDDGFPVTPERLAVHVGDLPDRRVRLDRVHEDRHEVLPVPARVRDPAQLVGDLGGIPRRLDRANALDLVP